MNWIRQSFWVADLCVLAMVAFFVLLGGVSLTQAPLVLIALVAMALVGAAQLGLHRLHRDTLTRMPESRRLRERRGF